MYFRAFALSMRSGKRRALIPCMLTNALLAVNAVVAFTLFVIAVAVPEARVVAFLGMLACTAVDAVAIGYLIVTDRTDAV